MSQSSKAAMHEKRKSDTGRGLYSKVRSKFIKGKDGYGAVVTLASEIAREKIGGPLPEGSVVHHLEGGSSVGNGREEESKSIVTTRAKNTAESNYRRGGKSKAWIKKKLGFQ